MSACTHIPRLSEPAWQQYGDHVELAGVPYFPEDKYQCGPQSLAMVLDYAGLAANPADLKDDVYVPGRKGSFAPELRAAARVRGRLPYRIGESLDALMKALADGYPVLIMQNVGLGFAPVWHFAVTVGFDRSEDIFILRTGPYERRTLSTRKFERRWRLADHWAIVVLTPHDFPDWLDEKQYEEQLALMESQWGGQMVPIYRGMLDRWPRSTMALLGLGNAAYARHDLQGSADYYRRILAIDPDHAGALNNLAQVSHELGQSDEAIRYLCHAKRVAKDSPLESIVSETEASLRQDEPDFTCAP